MRRGRFCKGLAHDSRVNSTASDQCKRQHFGAEVLELSNKQIWLTHNLLLDSVILFSTESYLAKSEIIRD